MIIQDKIKNLLSKVEQDTISSKDFKRNILYILGDLVKELKERSYDFNSI